jgi:dihydroneopterin triphosphate diphosphatase
MRAPFQVLVIPFRYTSGGLQFAVLKRSDAGWWQFVAGGGEDGESALQAAQRETREEIGLTDDGRILQLDSLAAVPKNAFAASTAWGSDIYVIPEYCFAIDTGDRALALSDEHTELCWASYEQAWRLLKWDSNRTALWELNERLKSANGSHGTSAPAPS